MRLNRNFLEKNKFYLILSVLFLISLISSSILAFFPIDSVCSSTSGCAVVYKSGYSSLLFGIDNSRLGFIAFLVVLVITISHIFYPKKEKDFIIKIAIIFSSIIAIYFIYLQTFVIGAFCKYCMVVDISSILSLIVLFFTNKKNIK